MRVDLTPAIVLHRRAWRETSFIVEAFSREHGRIGVVAKGARRPKSRWRGLLEPLAALELAWSGRGELYTLTDIDTRRRHSLAGNALMAGFYASELVMRLTARDDPHPAIHDSLAALLVALDDRAPAVVALRFFERDLLDELGYGVPLDITSDTGEPVEAAVEYVYAPELGLRRRVGRVDDDEVAIAGSALQGLVSGRFGGRADVHAARTLMQRAIAPHLGTQPLKSVQTLKAMQAFKASGVASTEPDNSPSGDCQ
ncbi:DNA repair protein RecO [uncultured Salinisphaera sp.]|uniref:DNA repair protein RecO n=1 Tax=uncultured Salinisphaera sp. TaxID=359372 RepID=UPI0032B15D23